MQLYTFKGLGLKTVQNLALDPEWAIGPCDCHLCSFLEGHLCYILGFGLLALLALENCLWISHLALSWDSNCEY